MAPRGGPANTTREREAGNESCEADDADRQARDLVLALGHLVSRTLIVHGGDDEVLTLHEARALGSLARLGPTRMRAFACSIGLHVSTATRTVDRLVRKGLVSRTSADDDRRCVIVSLSDRGLARESCLLELRTRRARELLAMLTPEERAPLIAGLRRLADTELCASLIEEEMPK